jgi:DNA-binding CsgD family transcriptional regulator
VTRGPAAGLTDRHSERGALDRLIEAVRIGESRTLVVRGDPGVGKTVLLDYLSRRASAAECRVARAAGVQTEMELAFAGLHQLCRPMLDHAGELPVPQREALQTALGISAGPPPDRFLVGLAVLSLLSEVAGDQPLVCIVDDQQWLDRASAQALGFAARRLGAEPVGLVFATRVPGDELTGLPELEVNGLREEDARALLESALSGPLDARIRDRIVAETQGNPLALLELPRGLTPTELAGGFGLPHTAPLPGRIEESFRRQLEALPPPTRRLLLVAAAEPYGDLSLVWRAAGRLGIDVQAATPALDAGLVEFGARVRFRHPLLRAASYRLATVADRQEVHAMLAEVTDPAAEPDRRAWHRAKAAAGPDEAVAAELERSADRAQARGGLAAAAAFLERSVLLTLDPARRAERTLAAAQANLQAGSFGTALELLATAEAGPLDELQSARIDLLRGEIVFASGVGSDASPLLLKAAKRLESLNLDLARETYLTAWMAALFAGRLAGAGDLAEVSRAARALPPPTEPPPTKPRPVDLVLDSLALLVTDGPAAAAPALRRAVAAFTGPDITTAEELRWGWLAQGTASALWDDGAWRAMLTRQLPLTRDAGALERLPLLLASLGTAVAWTGDFAAAAALVTEVNTVCAATGSRAAPFTAMMLAALRGDHAEATRLIQATIADATAAGQGIAVAYAQWVAAILANGLGRYEEALVAASAATEDTATVYIAMWALPELIEAAARSGQKPAAALERLTDFTQPAGTDFGLGLQARCRALLSEGQAAEDLYREAIDRLGRTELRPELARAHLLYGEWLRRENRRVDARVQLRAAHDSLDAIGMAAFAERARRELLATGETVRKRSAEPASELTAQEAQIARLVVDGHTNPEIGAQLFLSARTVEWHLRKVFTKLGITSRRDLRRALADLGPPAGPPAGPAGSPAGQAPRPPALVAGGTAAVDVQDLAGDVRRRLQEQDAVDHVADLAGPAHRRQPVAQPFVAVGRVHRGLDDARRDGVDPDAARGVLDGQGSGHRGQAALGQRGQRAGLAGRRGLGLGGCDVDHVTAVPPDHLGDDPPGQPEEPVQVDPGDQRVVLRGVLGERLGDEHAGVVDQRVDAPEPLQRGVGDPVGGGGLGDVAGHGEHVRVLRGPDLAGVGHHRPAPPAVPGHQPRADALGTSGDDGDPAARVVAGRLAHDRLAPS